MNNEHHSFLAETNLFPAGHSSFPKDETLSLPFYLGNSGDFLKICSSTTLDHEPSKQVSCLRKPWKMLTFKRCILCLLDHKFGVFLYVIFVNILFTNEFYYLFNFELNEDVDQQIKIQYTIKIKLYLILIHLENECRGDTRSI